VGDPDDAQGPPASDRGPGGPPQVPTCYRHTDRETYIRCSRCERPICPDCMHEASVGFQCPECVRAGNRPLRQGRTVFGGRVHQDTALLTKALVGINVVMFLAEQVSPAVEQHLWMFSYAIAFDGQYYRLLTSAFLHAGIAHILFNMYALYLFGQMIEAAFGRVRFLVLYLSSALAGAAASYMFSDPHVPSVGASGAIFGLLGATLVVMRRLRANARVVAALIVINLVLGFVIPRIDWRDHLGGLAAGLVIGAAFAYAPPRLRVPLGAAAVGVVLLASALMVVARTHALTGGI